MDTNLLMNFVGYPAIGKLALNLMKKRAFRPFQLSPNLISEKQEKKLKKKLQQLKHTEIGKKLGIKDGTRFQEIAVTKYDFYEPFFRTPSLNTLMYPIEEYERIRTSGTSGKEKWFLMPRRYINKNIIETAIPALMISTYKEKGISMEYGDTIYVNTAPRPFLGGVMTSVASGKKERPPFFNVVPNFNLAFEDKVKYFENNSDTIDIAVTQASIFVSKIMPSLKERLTLKGLFCPDTPIAEAYKNEIIKVAGTCPTTCYGSTETLFCSIPSVQHQLGFFLDWRQAFFEFIPIKKEEKNTEKTLELNEVKVGNVYRAIVTNMETELTRYDTNCAFKCIARGDDIVGIDTPIFKFHARLEKTISLHNFTRIGEDELIKVLDESGIQYVEFTTRVIRADGLEYLVIYLETTGREDHSKVSESIHKGLCQDNDYRELTEFYDYVPIIINFLPSGVFGQYLLGKVATVSKVERIGMNEWEFSRLAHIAKSVDRLWQSN